MKIVYICNEYPPLPHGGIGSFTQLIAEKLVAQNHQVTVLGFGDNQHFTQLNLNGVSVQLMPAFKKNWGKLNALKTILFQFKFQRFVRKQLSIIQPDLMETYDWGAPLTKKIGNYPLVIRLHGSNTVSNIQSGKAISPFYFRVEKKALEQADVTVSVSQFTGKLTQKTFGLPAQFTTIYNGVNTDQFFPQPVTRDTNTLLFVGRMHYYKGLDDLFPALNEVFSRNQNIVLKLVCTVIESFKSDLLNMVNPEFHSRIQFLGRIPNSELANCYSQANLTIVPSKTEAFPIVPLESMACGTPVLITDGFSAPEIVRDGINGFLIHPQDPILLASEILRCFEQQEVVEQMRERCIQTIRDQFSLAHVLETNIEFYLKTVQHDNH
jgi:starch synthase